MKKLAFSFILIFAFLKTQAQMSFDWIANDDTVKSIPVADSILAFDGDLKNNTNRPLDLLIVKQSVSNSKNWANYICAAGTCYPPNQDTLRLSVAANETIEMKFDVDVVAPINGDFATFKVTIVNNQNVDEIIVRNFRVNVNQTNRNKSVSNIFAVYPNPVSKNLLVKNLPSHAFQLEVLNLNGQQVLSQNQSSLDVQSLTPGMYLLKIQTIEGYTEFHRFIKE